MDGVYYGPTPIQPGVSLEAILELREEINELRLDVRKQRTLLKALFTLLRDHYGVSESELLEQFRLAEPE